MPSQCTVLYHLSLFWYPLNAPGDHWFLGRLLFLTVFGGNRIEHWCYLVPLYCLVNFFRLFVVVVCSSIWSYLSSLEVSNSISVLETKGIMEGWEILIFEEDCPPFFSLYLHSFYFFLCLNIFCILLIVSNFVSISSIFSYFNRFSVFSSFVFCFLLIPNYFHNNLSRGGHNYHLP